MTRRWLYVPLLTLALACGGARPAAKGVVAAGTPDEVNLAMARAREQKQLFAWASWSPEVFERARREKKFLLIDGAAAWCHWCHVMDETTYLDPEIGKILAERFVAIKVDIDERPDVGERYGDWGWPATVLLTPEAEEIGKYRGYLPPEEFRGILRQIDALASSARGQEAKPAFDEVPAPLEALGWVGARALRDMDSFYDKDQGGWGMRQKAPLGANVEIELRRAGRGDAAALGRAVFTLTQQRPLLDPVWGGVYQYSAGRTWNDPHFEKLMSIQAASIEAYARGYAASRDASLLADARKIAGYLRDFLTSSDGAFWVSQDADVNAHDPSAPFVDGHVFYSRDDAGRRALGLPRVDRGTYPHENGLAIAALSTLAEVSGEASYREAARRAADVMLAKYVAAGGEVKRDAPGLGGVRLLADAAALSFGLARLSEVSGEASYREAAQRIVAVMDRDLSAPGGAFYERTVDPAAAGVFARRDRPFNHNVTAARALAALARLTRHEPHRERARAVLAAIATPRALDNQGRMVGAFVLALDEAGALRW